MSDDPDDPSIAIAVSILDTGWQAAVPDADGLARRSARAALAAVPEAEDLPANSELSLVFASDDLVRQLNRDYRGRDQATNVLSFGSLEAGGPVTAELPGQPVLIGDVVLARETLCREAEARGLDVGDHLSHLVVHGILHLLGYDHGTEAEARHMETLETKVLARLGLPDPYRRQSTAPSGKAVPVTAGSGAAS